MTSRATLLCLCLILLSACRVSFEHALENPPASNVDLSRYEGTWKVLSLAGETLDAPLTVSLTRDGGWLRIENETTAGNTMGNAVLTEIEGRVIASIRDANGLWDIVSISLSAEGNRIRLGVMNEAAVKDAVDYEVLAAEVFGTYEREKQVTVTSEGPELRSYVGSRQDLFIEGAIVMERAT